MATWMNLNLQNSNNPLFEQLIMFHDHSMLILILITSFISYLIMTLFLNKNLNNNFISGQIVESIWTIMPAIILLLIAFPSLKLIYMLDEVKSPSITLKSMGHQWYWSYEYTNFKNIEFDSYMTNNNNFRLLENDNNIVAPMNSQIRLICSSTDVIHSWAMPSLGVKIDAIPGRLNQANFWMNRSGKFFGQCSEICGVNHSFMPITIESINMKFFLNWIKNN